MKKKISNGEALNALRDAVRTQPSGFVYNPVPTPKSSFDYSPDEECEYYPTVRHPETGCGIGVTLLQLGFTPEEIHHLAGGFRTAVRAPEDYGHESGKVWKKIEGMLPKRAVEAYDVFQVIQDRGGSWDLALAAAERVFGW